MEGVRLTGNKRGNFSKYYIRDRTVAGRMCSASLPPREYQTSGEHNSKEIVKALTSRYFVH
jgi:hypothetical protein